MATIASSPRLSFFTGKDLTVPIEQDNSNIRHFLARFRRRTKVASKSTEMVDFSLRLYHHCMTISETSPHNSLFSSLSLVRTLYSAKM